MAKGITIPLIVDPSKAIAGLGQVEGKSTSVAGTLGKLGGVAAVGIAALGSAAVGSVAGLVAASKSAGEYAENVDLMASKTHLSTQAVQELQYASKITHVPIDTITSSMTKLTKSMGNAQNGNKLTTAAFKELGVATTDANGNLLSTPTVYNNVIAALGKVQNPAQRDVLAMQLLGKSATELNPLIDGSAGSLKDLSKQAQSSGSVLGTTALNGLSSLDDSFDKLEAGASAAKNALGLVLMPALTELGDQGSGLLGQFTNAILNANGDVGKAAPAIGSVVSQAVTFILGQLPTLLTVGSSIVTSLVQGVTKQAPSLIVKAVPVLLGFVTGLLGLLPKLVDAGAKVLIALVQGIAKSLPTLIPAAVSAITGIVQVLVNNLPLLYAAAVQLLEGLAKGLLAALPALISALPGIIIGLVKYFIGQIPQLINLGISLLTSLVSALPQIITAIVKALPQIITGIITALLKAIPQLVEAGVQLLIALVTDIPAIIIALVKAVPMIVLGLVKAFTDPATLKQIGAAGVQMINGLWAGIRQTGDWLWKQIKGFFGGLLDKIKDFLGIHSPSTVFAGYGTNLIAGLVGGIQGGYGVVSSTMSGLADQVKTGISGTIGVDARAVISGGGGAASGTTVVAQTTNNFPNFLGFDKAGTAKVINQIMTSGRRNGDIPAGWATNG